MEDFVYNDHLALEGSHWWFRGRRDYINKVIQRFVEPIGQELALCEIGSGTGGNLSTLSNYGSVDGVEMNDYARGQIKSQNIDGVDGIFSGHLPDNINLPRKYHAIFALDVIEHVEEDLEGVRELFKHLRPNAKLVLTVPAYQWLWSSHDVANHHHRRYTKRQICGIITQAGFEVEYSSYFNSILFPLAALVRMVGKLSPQRFHSKSNPHLKLPPAIINKLFYGLFSSESKLAGKISIPFGLSIMVVAKKI